MLKRNLVANYLGQGWTALMGLAFVPIYIKYLGIESYGLIGLFTALTAWLSLLDMGMTPALGREMARFTGGNSSEQQIRDLLRTIEIIFVSIAVLIASIVMLGADWITTSWLKTENLPTTSVIQACTIMGVITALRFIEGIYRSAIIGLQRQVMFNVVSSFLATTRGLGAIAILEWISPSIEAFFLWQAIISVASLILLAICTYQSIPESEFQARFSFESLRRIWSFAGGMLGITFLSLLLTQIDKILLSKILSLAEFGYYILASTVAGMLQMLIGPITQAWLPRLCDLHARGQKAKLAELYHQGAQLVSVLAGSCAIVLIFFSEPLLRLWSQDSALAARTAPLLSLLALGNLLNGLMNIPYITQIAHGWTSLTVRINIIAVITVVPALIFITPEYGSLGAGWVWIGLNTGYLLLGVHFMYLRILRKEKWLWYGQDILFPLGAGITSAALLKHASNSYPNQISDFTLLVLAGIITLATSFLSAKLIRKKIFSLVLSKRMGT